MTDKSIRRRKSRSEFWHDKSPCPLSDKRFTIKGVGVETINGKCTGRLYIKFWNNRKIFTKGKLTEETERVIRELQAEVMRR